MKKINLYLWLLLSFFIIVGSLWILSNRASLRKELRETLAPITLELEIKNIQVGKLLAQPLLTKTPKTDTKLWLNNDFIEESEYGNLPKRNQDNKPVYQAYSSTPVKISTSSLTIIVVKLGFNSLSNRWALNLPSKVTLAYSPYAKNIQSLLSRARGLDFEVFLDLPMSPPSSKTKIIDSGPLGLNLKKSELLKNSLYRVLAQSTGYVGMFGNVAQFITSQPKNVARILGELENRGLLYLDKNAKSTSKIINSFGQSKFRPTANLIVDSSSASPEQLTKTYEFIVNSLKKTSQSAIWIVPSQQLSLIVLNNLLSGSSKNSYTLITFSQLAKLSK